MSKQQPQICIRLTDSQKQDIINAINSKARLTLDVSSRQIDTNGDWLHLNKKQAKDVYHAMLNNGHVRLQFSKAQMQKMRSQIGNGILDSLGSFFKSIPTKVSNAYNSAKNYIAPRQTPKQDISKGWNFVDKNTGKTNKDLAKRYDNAIEMHNMASIKSKPNVGYIQNAPKPSMIDRLGNWANNVDKGIDKAFNYGDYAGSSQFKQKAPLPEAWKQKVGYAPNGFFYEDF